MSPDNILEPVFESGDRLLVLFGMADHNHGVRPSSKGVFVAGILKEQPYCGPDQLRPARESNRILNLIHGFEHLVREREADYWHVAKRIINGINTFTCF